MTAYPAIRPVCCDGGKCRQTVEVQLPFRHEGIMPWSGHYDGHPDTLKRILQHKHQWIENAGKHYCSRECFAFAARPVKEKSDG